MKIYLDFLQIGSRLWTTQFSYGYLASLEVLITEFFTCYIFTHFLLHYTKMIKTFGWLIKPLRFKSKQGYFKSYLEWNKNRENLFQSMSKKDNLYFVDKAKGRISKQVFQENKARQIVRKTNISYPLICTRTCTC